MEITLGRTAFVVVYMNLMPPQTLRAGSPAAGALEVALQPAPAASPRLLPGQDHHKTRLSASAKRIELSILQQLGRTLKKTMHNKL